MSIKEQIKQAIQTTDRDVSHFAFSYLVEDEWNQFKVLTTDFLDATTYGEAERNAGQLMTFVQSLHKKNHPLGAGLQQMNIFELFYGYENRKKQRRHYFHQANVFLLGLYIYHNFEYLQGRIQHEMEQTTPVKINPTNNRRWRYSGATPQGEFFYRWRLASLSHDIGTGISLVAKDDERTRVEYIRRLHLQNLHLISTLSDLWVFNGIDLKEQLDNAIPELNLRGYMDYEYHNPFHNKVAFDHGILSGLLFLRLLHDEYDLHINTPVTRSIYSDVMWDPILLSTSILQMAVAISLHNIDQNRDAFNRFTNKTQIFDIQERPLAWLLKISDILQEWDKPLVVPRCSLFQFRNVDEIKPTSINITFDNERIIIRNFPNDKKVKVVETLLAYTTTSDLFEFR